MPELVNTGNVHATAAGGGVRLDSVIAALGPELVADTAFIDSLITSLIGPVSSNANGSFVRLANGLQVCWNPTVSLAYVNSTTLRAVWTFPAAFNALPAVAPNLRGWSTFVVGTPIALTAVDTATLEYRATGFTSGNTVTFSALAIGTWL